ncbi:MAG: hypothetical protein QOC64_2628 [Solirubrobacteraceae bacterium]|jgi:hypothetical protein|nr:hypothetical protein [Solirubrobacteraceae bacterium]
MPTRSLRRIAAPLLVVAGSALFGIGAGGIAHVDTTLDAASRPAAQPQAQRPPAVGVRGWREHSHREAY